MIFVMLNAFAELFDRPLNMLAWTKSALIPFRWLTYDQIAAVISAAITGSQPGKTNTG